MNYIRRNSKRGSWKSGLLLVISNLYKFIGNLVMA